MNDKNNASTYLLFVRTVKKKERPENERTKIQKIWKWPQRSTFVNCKNLALKQNDVNLMTRVSRNTHMEAQVLPSSYSGPCGHTVAGEKQKNTGWQRTRKTGTSRNNIHVSGLQHYRRSLINMETQSKLIVTI
jgi:hypothetical protein